jgi:hypothetical protein
MLEIVFILFNIIAFLLFFIGITHEEDHPFWNIIMTMWSWILFLVLLAFSTSIEIPYSMFNATSGFVQTGYQNYQTGVLIYIYFAFFIPAFVYFLDLVFHKQLIKLFKKP